MGRQAASRVCFFGLLIPLQSRRDDTVRSLSDPLAFSHFQCKPISQRLHYLTFFLVGLMAPDLLQAQRSADAGTIRNSRGPPLGAAQDLQSDCLRRSQLAKSSLGTVLSPSSLTLLWPCGPVSSTSTSLFLQFSIYPFFLFFLSFLLACLCKLQDQTVDSSTGLSGAHLASAGCVCLTPNQQPS